jgi:hypothetical protein
MGRISGGRMSSESRQTPEACPGCGQQAFYVSPRDKRVGQCLECGIQRRIDPASNVANDAMFRIYEFTHQALFATTEGAAVIDALIERGIEAEVLLHSTVGVIPAQLDAKALFQEAIRTAETAVESLEASKPKGRPTNDYLAAKAKAESKLAALRGMAEQVARAVQEVPGGLGYFYTDSDHNIVACKVSPPDSREVDGLWNTAPSPTRGLFNHGMFGRTRRSGLISGPDRLLLVDDPMSVPQIQSTLYRAAIARGESGRDAYMWVAAFADVIDEHAVRETCRTPVVCYSATAAGRARIEALREHVTLTGFTAPPSGTLGDWLVEQGDQFGLTELRQQISGAELFTRPYPAVRAEVDGVRRSEGPFGLKKFQADRWASDIVGRDLSERGRLYHDGRVGCVLLSDTHEVIPFDLDNDEYRLLMNRYGVSGRDTLAKPLLEHLDVRARNHGTKAEVHTSSHFDRERFVCYVFITQTPSIGSVLAVSMRCRTALTMSAF